MQGDAPNHQTGQQPGPASDTAPESLLSSRPPPPPPRGAPPPPPSWELSPSRPLFPTRLPARYDHSTWIDSILEAQRTGRGPPRHVDDADGDGGDDDGDFPFMRDHDEYGQITLPESTAEDAPDSESSNRASILSFSEQNKKTSYKTPFGKTSRCLTSLYRSSAFLCSSCARAARLNCFRDNNKWRIHTV